MKSILFFVLLATAFVYSQNDFIDVLFIDDFTVETTTLITVIPNNPSFPIVLTSFTGGPTANIIGGERDLQLTTLAGDQSLVLTSGVAAGDFSCASPNGASGRSLLQYDGVDGSMDLVAGGLGSVDFTAQNGFALRATAQSDLPTTITFNVYSGQNSCSRTISLSGGNVPFDFIEEFSSFSGNCDFTNVGGFEVDVNMGDNVDVLIQVISVYAPVPLTPSPSRTRSPAPSVSPSPSPSASDTCVCRCPIFVCEVFRVDDGNYYFYDTTFFVPFFGTFFAYFIDPTFFNNFFVNPPVFFAPFTTFFLPPVFFGNFFDIWSGIYFYNLFS